MNDLTKRNSLGKSAAMISLDLSSAFNLLHKAVLILKLKSLGVGKEAISWIDSFLSDRTQQVRINETLSSPRNIKIGTVQGSKLSPILFFCLLTDIKAEMGEVEELSTNLQTI